MPGALLDVFDVVEGVGSDHGMWKSGKMESEGLMAANCSRRRKGKIRLLAGLYEAAAASARRFFRSQYQAIQMQTS
jgi:hypothetical protein